MKSVISHDQLERLVFIDTETGGLNPFTDSILSIGLVSWNGQQTEELFIREPTLHCHPRSMEINKIDLSWIQDYGKSPKKACECFEAYFSHLQLSDTAVSESCK